jgi:lipopolysaccharide transport system ATP-binding protein
MYVRLAFAVAAHLEPEILIVDEVLAGGDAQFQKKCLGKMQDVGNDGRTVLFVSHNLSAVKTLCNRAVLLNKGIVIADNSVGEVIKEYTDELKENVLSCEFDKEKAPQNSSAIVTKVRICDDAGRDMDSIDTDTPFNVEIEFKVIKKGANVGLTVILYDNENNCVLSSINNHENDWYGKPMDKGLHRSVCKFPGKLLNYGWFHLSLNLFGKNFSDQVMTNDVLKIEVLDGAVVRGDYFGHYGGYIRPMFHWKTEVLNTKEL